MKRPRSSDNDDESILALKYLENNLIVKKYLSYDDASAPIDIIRAAYIIRDQYLSESKLKNHLQMIFNKLHRQELQYYVNTLDSKSLYDNLTYEELVCAGW